jgi:FKBP12-rapamycin complex-associated protein
LRGGHERAESRVLDRSQYQVCPRSKESADERLGSAGYDSAWSTLLLREDKFGAEVDPMWITQLSHWDRALDLQNQKESPEEVTTFNAFNTRMICCKSSLNVARPKLIADHALGQFDRGYELAQSHYEGLDDHQRRKTSHWATAAAWHMVCHASSQVADDQNDFDAMGDYLAFHPKGTSKSIYKAIIDVQSGEYPSAYHHIQKAQALAHDELQNQLAIGPQVALKTLAKTECLVELNEVIQYKSQPEMRDHILSVWRARFKRSHDDPNSWLKRLQVWTLACDPTTPALQHCYLDCAKLCESNGMHEVAKRILERVTPANHPPVSSLALP